MTTSRTLGMALALGCVLSAGCGKYGPPRRIVEVAPPSSPQTAPTPAPETSGTLIPSIQPPTSPEELEEDQAP